MPSALKAGFTYFLLVFAVGFMFGTVRTLLITPALGDLAAVLIELPIILIVSWFACGYLVRHFQVSNAFADRVAMGAVAFVLLLAAEALVSATIGGRDLGGHFALYKTAPVIIGLFGQIMFALFPLVFARTR